MKSLIVVDIQNDFLPGGALAVAGGDAIIPIVNQLMEAADLVVATQDWHPANHESFTETHPGRAPGDVIELHGLTQTLWPVHCVQETPGAQFAPGLETDRFDHVVRKGTHRTVDSYSGFFDNGHRKATGLGDYLRGKNVNEVTIAGLATDYCVKFTSLDAAELGFKTTVITDACRNVDLREGDVELALEEMREHGIGLLESSEAMRQAN